MLPGLIPAPCLEAVGGVIGVSVNMLTRAPPGSRWSAVGDTLQSVSSE